MQSLASILLAGDSFAFMFVLVIVGGVIALVVWSINRQKKIREAWLKFARSHNLQVQGATNRPTIQGWYGSTWIALNTVVRGSGKNRSTYTQHHATINAPMPQGLVLYKEGFFSKMGKVFGGQDVQTGDRQLDDAFIIKGQDLLGIHELLNLQPIKQALLYTIARHPGMRIDQRRILVEHNGMTGDINNLEAMFSDLSYLVQTFDAGYQELVNRKGGEAPKDSSTVKQKTRSAPKTPPATSKAAAAEILGAGFFKEHSPEPASKDEALHQMADVLHQYEDKLEKGEIGPDVLHDFSPANSMDNVASSAFSNQDTSDVFAASNTDGRSALDDYDPNNVWHSRREDDNPPDAFKEPDAGDAFADPTPFDAESQPSSEPAAEPEQPEDEILEVGVDFDAIIAQLSESSLMSSDREKLIEANVGKTWEVELIVDRIDSTWGFDIAEELKDGKTVEAKLKDGDTKITMRFPKERNDEIGKLRSGETLKAWGTIAAWDDLFKKATLNAS